MDRRRRRGQVVQLTSTDPVDTFPPAINYDNVTRMTDNQNRSRLKTVEKAMRILETFSHARPELSVG